MNLFLWVYRWVNARLHPVPDHTIPERKLSLVERTKVGLSPRANDSVVREAIGMGQSIFLQVRKQDGYVLCNTTARPTYWSKDFVDKHPEGAGLTTRWVEVDPRNPLAQVELGEDGCWYYKGG